MTVSRRPFTSEHEMLGKSIRDFVEREVTPQGGRSGRSWPDPCFFGGPDGVQSR
jgi:hypothetical protein